MGIFQLLVLLPFETWNELLTCSQSNQNLGNRKHGWQFGTNVQNYILLLANSQLWDAYKKFSFFPKLRTSKRSEWEIIPKATTSALNSKGK